MNPEKRKRVIVGCVLCAAINSNYKRYFQFIGRDLYCLNTDVIRVFKNMYCMDYHPQIEEITNDDVDFYTHTSISAGIKQDLWYIVGKSNNIGNPKNVGFYAPHNPLCFPITPKSTPWEVWTLGCEQQKVERLKSEHLQNYHYGYAFAPTNVLYRMEHGVYKGLPQIDEVSGKSISKD